MRTLSNAYALNQWRTPRSVTRTYSTYYSDFEVFSDVYFSFCLIMQVFCGLFKVAFIQYFPNQDDIVCIVASASSIPNVDR